MTLSHDGVPIGHGLSDKRLQELKEFKCSMGLSNTKEMEHSPRNPRTWPVNGEIVVTGSMITAKLAVEYWKLLRAFERALERLPAEDVAKTTAQARFARGRLEVILREGGLSLNVFDGKQYEANLPVTVMNVDEFGKNENLIVRSTIEPTVTEGMQILMMGKVILGKGHGDASGN